MARSLTLFWILVLGLGISALEVTPNSPCASLCLDSTQHIGTNSTGSGAGCKDSDYESSDRGQKAQACLSCLQLSKTNDGASNNDQRWFLYNLRYILSSCFFGSGSSLDIDSTPCSTTEFCGPLQEAIDVGNFVTSDESTYSYCSADSHALLVSSALPRCVRCLREEAIHDSFYLANFMLTLEAGCRQQPVGGWIIGLNSSVFSQYPVVETSAGSSYNTTTSQHSKSQSLSTDTIIGLSVGLPLLAILAVTLFILWFRRQNRLDRQQLMPVETLHERYGNPNITAPTDTVFGNPFHPTPTPTSMSFVKGSLTGERFSTKSTGFPRTVKHLRTDSKSTDTTSWPGYDSRSSIYDAGLPINHTGLATHHAQMPTKALAPGLVHQPPHPKPRNLTPFTLDYASSSTHLSPYAGHSSSPKPPYDRLPTATIPFHPNTTSHETPFNPHYVAQQPTSWAAAKQKSQAQKILTDLRAGQKKTDCSPASATREVEMWPGCY